MDQFDPLTAHGLCPFSLTKWEAKSLTSNDYFMAIKFKNASTYMKAYIKDFIVDKFTYL